MTAEVDSNLTSLVLDLLEWVTKEPRTYKQTMDAWRTSCPRLAVWEEAVDYGFVVREPGGECGRVKTTERGLVFLMQQGRTSTLLR